MSNSTVIFSIFAAAAFPTLMALLGILLNRKDASDLRTEIASLRVDISGLRSEISALRERVARIEEHLALQPSKP